MDPLRVTVLKPNQPVALPSRIIQLLPTDLFILPTGATDETPSIALVLSAGEDPVVVTQCSLKMILSQMPIAALNRLGLEVSRERERRGLH